MAIKSINIKFPMVRGTAGVFDTNNTTSEAIKDNLRILILSNHGERPIHYNFGANLRSVLFEQGENLKQQVQDKIAAAVAIWLPFVSISQFSLQSSSDNKSIPENQVNVSIEFVVGQVKGKLSLPIVF